MKFRDNANLPRKKGLQLQPRVDCLGARARASVQHLRTDAQPLVDTRLARMPGNEILNTSPPPHPFYVPVIRPSFAAPSFRRFSARFSTREQ